MTISGWPRRTPRLGSPCCWCAQTAWWCMWCATSRSTSGWSRWCRMLRRRTVRSAPNRNRFNRFDEQQRPPDQRPGLTPARSAGGRGDDDGPSLQLAGLHLAISGHGFGQREGGDARAEPSTGAQNQHLLQLRPRAPVGRLDAQLVGHREERHRQRPATDAHDGQVAAWASDGGSEGQRRVHPDKVHNYVRPAPIGRVPHPRGSIVGCGHCHVRTAFLGQGQRLRSGVHRDHCGRRRGLEYLHTQLAEAAEGGDPPGVLVPQGERRIPRQLAGLEVVHQVQVGVAGAGPTDLDHYLTAARLWHRHLGQTPPTTITALFPATAVACSTADSTPSVTKVKVRRSSCLGVTCGGSWVHTRRGTWNSYWPTYQSGSSAISNVLFPMRTAPVSSIMTFM